MPLIPARDCYSELSQIYYIGKKISYQTMYGIKGGTELFVVVEL